MRLIFLIIHNSTLGHAIKGCNLWELPRSRTIESESVTGARMCNCNVVVLFWKCESSHILFLRKNECVKKTSPRTYVSIHPLPEAPFQKYDKQFLRDT
ncbi:Uncharacterized protein XB17_01834 [Leptospira santarosai]|nr:Uncharacterized protein XB17_01834 [Leptospira santarosai]